MLSTAASSFCDINIQWLIYEPSILLHLPADAVLGINVTALRRILIQGCSCLICAVFVLYLHRMLCVMDSAGAIAGVTPVLGWGLTPLLLTRPPGT